MTGGLLSKELASGFEALFALTKESRVAIREPEVWGQPLSWPPSEYHDGRLLSPGAAIALIGRMLANSEFWCRLVTDLVEIHVGESEVYIGMPGQRMDKTFPTAERVRASPYYIDRRAHNYYPPADEEFWNEMRREIASGTADMLVLRQWAAGFGGERWHRVASVGDVDIVQQDAIPRALYAVFRSPRLMRMPQTQAILSIFVDESPLSSVRLLRDLDSVRLSAEHVADHDELRAWNEATDGGLLFIWDDDVAVTYAAQPDADGQVRVAASFA